MDWGLKRHRKTTKTNLQIISMEFSRAVISTKDGPELVMAGPDTAGVLTGSGLTGRSLAQ